MSLDPQERLEALRREVLAEQPAPTGPPTTPAGTSDAAAGTSDGAAARPDGAAAEAPAPPTPRAPPPTAPTAIPEPPPMGAPTPPPVADPTPPPVSAPPAPQPSHQPRSSTGTQVAGLTARLVSGIGDFDVRGLLADRSLSSWLGIALLVVGGYLVLSWVVPGVQVIGSLALLVAGVVLLYLHLARGGPPWMLYAGAALAGMGAARVIGALLPGAWHGTTAIGAGVAFLAIGYLRHSQAGGYGWQGVVGGAAIALGLVQLVLGWLPGTPGLFDLVSPAVLLVVGALLVLGTRWLDRSRSSERPR